MVLTRWFGVGLAVLILACADEREPSPRSGVPDAGPSGAALRIAPGEPSILLGGKRQLQAIAIDSDGAESDVTAAVLWATSRPEVLAVEGGLVATTGRGVATVSAQLGDLSASTLVTVEQNHFTTSPADGEAEVAVTRETTVTFAHALVDGVTVGSEDLYAEFGGERLETRVRLSADRRTLTLFYRGQTVTGRPGGEPTLPASARVRVTLVGDRLVDGSGAGVDVDGDGRPGGTTHFSFDTLSLTLVEGTSVSGRVFTSELGEMAGATVHVPLAHVAITIDGIPSDRLHAYTDALGNFQLSPVPAGRFFVHIEGRTATHAHTDGSYYPVVGKAWRAEAGTDTPVPDIYLPRIPGDALVPVSESEDTPVGLAASTLSTRPELAGMELVVPAGAAISDIGGGSGGGMRVGLAAVPADRLPSPLPPGLDLPVVITVQSDQATNFDRPAPVCFPNLSLPATGQPLAPGASSALWSFNHDVGEWEIAGPMTVTADGTRVCTDPGFGILAPGWHGSQPGTEAEIDPRELECDGWRAAAVVGSMLWGGISAAVELSPIGKAAKCIGGTLLAAGAAIYDLRDAARARSATCQVLGSAKASIGFIASAGGACAPGPANVLEGLSDVCSAAAEAVRELRAGGDLEGCSLIPDVLREYSGELAAVLQAGAGAKSVERAYRDLYHYLPAAGDSVFAVGAKAVETIDALGCPGEGAGAAGRAGGAAGDDVRALDETTAAGLARFADLYEQFSRDVESTADPRLEESARQVVNATQRLMREVLPRLGESVFAHHGVRVRGEQFRTQGVGRRRIILPPETPVTASVFVPRTREVIRGSARSARAGQRSHIGAFLFGRAPAPRADRADTDLDTLPDDAEEVLGTDPARADSDGDGVSDGAEVDQGTNPVDPRVVQTGIIAAVDTAGFATDVCAHNDQVAVALRDAGVVLFNVFGGREPTMVARIDTPGAAGAVACGVGYLAVADGAAGVAIVDVTEPPRARVAHEVGLGAPVRAVAVGTGVVFAGTAAGRVAAVDPATGTVVEEATVGQSIDDLAVGGDFLYILSGTSLHALSIERGLRATGRADSPARAGSIERGRLFVGTSLAYATHRNGYNAFDLSSPGRPVPLGPGQTPEFGWTHLVDDGSGLGIAAMGPNPEIDPTHDVALYDLSDPRVADGSNFLTRFSTPGFAAAVASYGGLAYVADGEAGLQVIQYRSRDVGGRPPGIAVAVEPAAASIEEGRTVRLVARVTDDVQVRTVELFVNGRHVVTDGSFPFEHRLPVVGVGDPPTFTVRARAVDTGGNGRVSDEVRLQVLRDTRGPVVLAVQPADGAAVVDARRVAAFFDEPLGSPSNIPATAVRVTSLGADGRPGADDADVTAGVLSYREDASALTLAFPAALAPGRYRASVDGPLGDRRGNVLGAPFAWTFCAEASGAAPYRATFEGGVERGFSSTTVGSTPIGERRFLGPLGAETVQFELGGLPAHDRVTLSFDLLVIGRRTGADRLTVLGESGEVLLDTSFSNIEGGTQAFPSAFGGAESPAGTGAAERDTLGFDGGDAVYLLNACNGRAITFAHAGASLRVRFTSTQADPTAGWGLDNVAVHLGGGGQACVPGEACVAAPCHGGLTSCAGGATTCDDTGAMPDGTPCGRDQVCRAGRCEACVSGQACTPADACHVGTTVCGSGQQACADVGTPVPDGTTCAAGQVCRGGACVACAAGSACTPADPCHVGTLSCSTGSPVCADTLAPAPDGTACGSGQVCRAGACVACPDGVSCVPADPCHLGTTSCATGSAVCADTGAPVPNGTSCGTNLVCSAGVCGACAEGLDCRPSDASCRTGRLDCSTGQPVCQDAGGNQPNGISCGAGRTCRDGACEACVEGAVCTPAANPCRTGTVSCATGVPVCVEQAAAVPDGTACEGGVCRAGACAPCGSACTPANPCRAGSVTCPGGGCVETTTSTANGTACGTDQVCRDGACVACLANQACDPGIECHRGVTSCATGSSTCLDAGNAVDGLSCGTDHVCFQGSCTTCVAGVSCTPPTQLCHVGETSCATGQSACVSTGIFVADNTPCGALRICRTGECECDEGGTCTPSYPCHLGSVSCPLAPASPVCVATAPNPVCGTQTFVTGAAVGVPSTRLAPAGASVGAPSTTIGRPPVAVTAQ